MVMAGLDPAIPLSKARQCHIIGIAGSNPAMTAGRSLSTTDADGLKQGIEPLRRVEGPHDCERLLDLRFG
jgi:hypothetical protein